MKKKEIEKLAGNMQNMNDILRSNLTVLNSNKNLLNESLDILSFIEFMLFDFFFYEGFKLDELVEFTENTFPEGNERNSAVLYIKEIMESFETEENDEKENN